MHCVTKSDKKNPVAYSTCYIGNQSTSFTAPCSNKKIKKIKRDLCDRQRTEICNCAAKYRRLTENLHYANEENEDKRKRRIQSLSH